MKTLLSCLLLVTSLQAAPSLPEGVDELLLIETTMHLYRWVLDEEDLDQVFQDRDLHYWVREVQPDLDEGDQSRFIEIWMPQIGLQVTSRKADYEIEEMNLTVKNQSFKIRNVLRGTPPESAEDFAEIRIPYEKAQALAFERRAQARYPEGEFLEALRDASRAEVMAYLKENNEEPPKGVQTLYFSPLSPVANDLWVFWENGGKLLRLASDMDLENPALWKDKGLDLKIFDIKTQTVVHLNEAKGSNAFMTRDQVGRYLFNCLILGKKVELTPPSE